MSALITLGETMGSFTADVAGPLALHRQHTLSFAGAESTVAIGVARLGHQSRWIGRVGDDEIGRLIVRTLGGEGVDVASVIVDPDGPTGVMIKENRVGDVVRVSYHRRASAGSALDAGDLPHDAIASARVLHVTGITPALSASAGQAVRRAVEIARGAGVPVSLDVNYRSRLWSRSDASSVLTPLARAATVVFGSADELAIVAGHSEISAAAGELLSAGVTTVVAKLGAAGAAAYEGGGRTAVAAVAVPVADVVGAGDAFVAGYLSALLDGLDVAARLQLGCTVAAFAVGSTGDWEGLPRRGELGLLGPEPTVR